VSSCNDMSALYVQLLIIVLKFSLEKEFNSAIMIAICLITFFVVWLGVYTKFSVCVCESE